MRRWIPLFCLALIAMSCEVTVVEPAPYDEVSEYLGTWNMDEYSDTFRSEHYYQIYIIRSRANYVYLKNFYDEGLVVRAEVRSGRLIIPAQIVNGYEIEGSGNRYDNRIDFNYSVFHRSYHPRITDFCQSVAYW